MASSVARVTGFCTSLRGVLPLSKACSELPLRSPSFTSSHSFSSFSGSTHSSSLLRHFTPNSCSFLHKPPHVLFRRQFTDDACLTQPTEPSNSNSLGKITPSYQMHFTCGVCDKRSARTFSKVAYHSGVVIITCDGCDNKHLIADNLGWFGDQKNIEEILASKGQSLRKGTVEFISSGSSSNVDQTSAERNEKD